jgi:hypothetical protein
MVAGAGARALLTRPLQRRPPSGQQHQPPRVIPCRATRRGATGYRQSRAKTITGDITVGTRWGVPRGQIDAHHAASFKSKVTVSSPCTSSRLPVRRSISTSESTLGSSDLRAGDGCAQPRVSSSVICACASRVTMPDSNNAHLIPPRQSQLAPHSLYEQSAHRGHALSVSSGRALRAVPHSAAAHVRAARRTPWARGRWCSTRQVTLRSGELDCGRW